MRGHAGTSEAMENIEIKAELRDIALARSICRSLGARHVVTMDQTDTYYRVATGRLKKRECPGEPTEWIYYERSDKAAARLSRFTIYTEDQARERFGEAELPVRVVIQKKRELYLLDNARIHLDTVAGLGVFLEIECLVGPSQGITHGHDAIASLRAAFLPVLGEVIAVGYADMLDPESSGIARAGQTDRSGGDGEIEVF
jgi:adenylate cyclase class IV